VTVSDEGETYLDGRRMEASELIAELEAIMQGRTDRASRTVRIEVDRRTRYRDYVLVVDAVNRVKGYVELKVKR
jgi:biopolymer transport protein ExbD